MASKLMDWQAINGPESQMMDEPRKKVGVMLPSSNTTVEYDFQRAAPANLSIHSARLWAEGACVDVLEEMTTQAFGIGTEGEQGLGGHPKQQVVHHALILAGELDYLPRHRKHDVEVRYRQQLRLPGGEPLFCHRALALRTMTSPARVIGNLAMGAGATASDVPAKGRARATLNRRHDLELSQTQSPGVSVSECRSVGVKDIRHLQRRSTQARCLINARDSGLPESTFKPSYSLTSHLAGAPRFPRSGFVLWHIGAGRCCTARGCLRAQSRRNRLGVNHDARTPQLPATAVGR